MSAVSEMCRCRPVICCCVMNAVHCVLSASTQPYINPVLKRASHTIHMLKLVNLNEKQIGAFIQISQEK